MCLQIRFLCIQSLAQCFIQRQRGRTGRVSDSNNSLQFLVIVRQFGNSHILDLPPAFCPMQIDGVSASQYSVQAQALLRVLAAMHVTLRPKVQTRQKKKEVPIDGAEAWRNFVLDEDDDPLHFGELKL